MAGDAAALSGAAQSGVPAEVRGAADFRGGAGEIHPVKSAAERDAWQGEAAAGRGAAAGEVREPALRLASGGRGVRGGRGVGGSGGDER